MGTETIVEGVYIPSTNRALVKLNKPLMGTETNHWNILRCIPYDKLVKLNKPLMGTETFIECLTISIYTSCQLLN